MASNLPINQYNQNVANAVKGVPGLGDLMKGLNSIAGTANDIMHQLLPGVFTGDTLQTLQLKAQSSVLQANYDAFKDDPLLVLIFTDIDKTQLNYVGKGDQNWYDTNVSNGNIVNGVSKDGKLIMPNIIKGIIAKIQAEEEAKLLQDQEVSQEKANYGPLYPIINWFNTNPTAQNITTTLKNGTTQIGQDIKTSFDKATGVQSGWSPLIIGILAVGGALAITYIILED